MNKILLFLVLTESFVFGQKSNLDALIQIGLNQNRDLSIALKQIDFQKALINTAYDVPKTKFDYAFGNIQTPGATDYSISGIQNSELPKVFKLKKSYNQSLIKIRESEYWILENEYKMNVATAYYNLYYLERWNNLLETENIKLTEIEKVYKKRLEEGETDVVESSNISLRILENQMKILKIKAQKQEIESSLKNILNMPSIPSLDFQNASKSSGQYFNNNAKLEWHQSLVYSSKNALETEKSKLLPSVNFGFMNQSMLGSWKQFVGMAGFEIPLFAKAQKARIEASKINVLIEETVFEKLKYQIENEILTLQNSLLNIENEMLLVNEKLLPASEKVAEIYMKKYLAGQINYFDWFLAYNQSLNYKTELINLEKARNINISTLKYLTRNE